MSADMSSQKSRDGKRTDNAATSASRRDSTAPDADWLSQPERGALLGMKLVMWLATAFGRWPARQLVRAVALYYALFDRSARAASRDWLTTVQGRAPSFGETYRHFFTFAQVTLDRFFFLRGKTAPFEISRTGNEHLIALQRTRQGAVLLGAHLGSFEAMRAGGREEAFDINIVGNFANARVINALFEDLGDANRARVIDVSDDSLNATLQMRERLEDGEMVALLGDRRSEATKSVTVSFFGRPARLPAGPFILASLLGCPVYLVFGLFHAPRHYALHCEPFAERIELPRGTRQQALQDVMQRYATRLEHYASTAPYCWFNFFEFWDDTRS